MSSGSRLDSLSPLPPSSRLLEPINQIRIRIPNETREISKALFVDLPYPRHPTILRLFQRPNRVKELLRKPLMRIIRPKPEFYPTFTTA
jgi:hypothetical protein